MLLSLGASAADECERMIDRLSDHIEARRALRDSVTMYFDLLDSHGGFTFARPRPPFTTT